MKCPFCRDLENKVIDSRLSKEGDVIRRRRECLQCTRRFTTYERAEEALPLVVKKDGRRETFDRLKIVAGLKRACEKRPVSIEAIVVPDPKSGGCQNRLSPPPVNRSDITCLSLQVLSTDAQNSP